MLQSLKHKSRAWARENLFTWNTIRYRVEFPRLLDAFRIIGKQGTVFDGGAGGGQMIRKVFLNGFCDKGIAFEYDPALYAILVENLSDIPAFETRQGSLLEIPYPDAHVDCAMTTQVLEHIEDHETAAKELARIVKPGGHLIISVPHPPEPFETDGHFREGYTEADLKALFPEPGFKLLSTGYSLTRPTIDRAIFAKKLPLGGMYLPVGWVDRETKLNHAERAAQLPYAITCLFQKM